MARRTTKRQRTAVSYKEPSSDEDLSGDSGYGGDSSRKRTQEPQRRSARNAAREQTEAGSDEEHRDASQPKATIAETENQPARGKRSLKRVVSYRESSSDEDSEAYLEQTDPLPTPTRRSTRTNHAKVAHKKTSTRARPRRGLGAPLKRRAASEPTTTAPTIPSDGNIPNWASLPYHVLFQIFVFASYPLHDNRFFPMPSISWLANVARLCTAFTAPALTALYRNPPIFALTNLQKRKDLVHHLISPPPNALQRYQVMPKRLELDASNMSHLTDPAHSAEDLLSLIRSLKTLRHIDIFDPLATQPYQAPSRRLFKYPPELFQVLEEADISLRSWHWNPLLKSGLRFSTKFPSAITIHAQKPFMNLKELTFTRVMSGRYPGEDSLPVEEEFLASALAILPKLETLKFQRCRVVNDSLLPLLPKNLASLHMSNCDLLTSEALHLFLVTHGRHLKELVLNHNVALDLSFLVDLKKACPELEVLRMDLNYFSSLTSSDDSDPLYDELIKEGEIPTWPSTLEILELEYLRKWSAGAAKDFFRSLIDSASMLPYLRVLKISAMVDIEWRARADFRKEWTARFDHVFRDRSPPPSEHLRSLRAFREWKEEKAAEKVAEEIKAAQSPVEPKRLRTRTRASSSGGETGDENSSSRFNFDDLFVQGRCEKVDFKIDNIRPREEKFSENDFLDSEASGDEDWDGDDDDVDGYAW